MTDHASLHSDFNFHCSKLIAAMYGHFDTVNGWRTDISI